ncbi:hypothetical protein EAF00_007048 [Botryotinia globosa]|nr:hypothetical protein EAF00_007048 [Botryotinia globosa]
MSVNWEGFSRMIGIISNDIVKRDWCACQSFFGSEPEVGLPLHTPPCDREPSKFYQSPPHCAADYL